jgi:hypothetical protein
MWICVSLLCATSNYQEVLKAYLNLLLQSLKELVSMIQFEGLLTFIKLPLHDDRNTLASGFICANVHNDLEIITT